MRFESAAGGGQSGPTRPPGPQGGQGGPWRALQGPPWPDFDLGFRRGGPNPDRTISLRDVLGVHRTLENPDLTGLDIFFQAAFLDLGAVQSLSLTNGLQTVIG